MVHIKKKKKNGRGKHVGHRDGCDQVGYGVWRVEEEMPGVGRGDHSLSGTRSGLSLPCCQQAWVCVWGPGKGERRRGWGWRGMRDHSCGARRRWMGVWRMWLGHWEPLKDAEQGSRGIEFANLEHGPECRVENAYL